MGYVYQGGELGRWYIGLQAFTVGTSFLANRDFVAQSHPYMRRLMEQSGETANLGILDGTEAVFIDQVQCREMMRTIVKLGSRVPLHASGVGKAIFAALPDEQIDAILKVKGLPRITANTITSPETMWASHARDPPARLVVRRRGARARHALRGGADLRRARRSARRDLARGTVVALARRPHQAAGAARRAHRRGTDAPPGRPLAAWKVTMKRTLVVAVVLAVVVAVMPWAIGWWTEHLVRARVAQVDVDQAAKIRLRVDSYKRGWGGATARISVADRQGAALVTLAADIRHWPFASGGPADWVAVPELGDTVREALDAWGEKLPELTTRTELSWVGDVHTQIESPAFKRRVPEVAGGTLEIGALSGTVDWRRGGALTYDFALPAFRIERQGSDAAAPPNVIAFKDVVWKGEGSLGTADRRWNQKGSFAAASLSVTEAGKPTFTAATPLITYANRDEGEYLGVEFTFAISGVSANYALQNLSDASLAFALDARHLAKEPLARFLDTKAGEPIRMAGQPGRAPASDPGFGETLFEVLRGSPAADLQFSLKAREGRVELKLTLAFDGLGFDPQLNSGNWLQRLDAELNARASTALVVAGTRAGTSAAAGMLRPPASAGNAITLPGTPPPDPDALARQQLRDAAAQGLVRLEGDDVVTTVRLARRTADRQRPEHECVARSGARADRTLARADDESFRSRLVRVLARQSRRIPIRRRRANGSTRSTRWSRPKAASARPTCCAGCWSTRASAACSCRRCSTRRTSNTIGLAEQPQFPGNLEIEQRLSAIVRWNALAMVVRANRAFPELGGHIASYASAADLFEVGFNHFFRAGAARGDLVYFQPHSATGVYARAFLEGRLDEDQLAHYRRETGGARAARPIRIRG